MKTYFVAIDVETTGLMPGYHTMVQLAAVPSWEAQPFNVWIWPDRAYEIDDESLKKSGYSQEQWTAKKAVCLGTALERFREWLEQAPVQPWKLVPIAHNAAFDRAFIEDAYRHCGRRTPLSHRWRCSMAATGFLMDAGLIPQGSTSLDALSGLCGLGERGEEHDALDDARRCMAAYCWLLRLPQGLADAATEKATTPSLN